MLGGRAYGSAATQTTFAQDGYLMGVVRANKLDVAINRDEDLLAAIFVAGCASALLAGLLTEDRKPWSVADAKANALYFDGLTADEDKSQLLAALEGLLAGFFLGGGRSSTHSTGMSSTRPPRKTAARGRKPRLPVQTPQASAETSGPESSPSSPSALDNA